MEKQNYIKNFFCNFGMLKDLDIQNESSVNKIYNLVKCKQIYNPENDIEMLCLAIYYEISNQLDKAVELYHLAVKKGNDMAMHNLGDMYLYGRGVDRNIKKAIEFFEMAIKKGNCRTMNRLGFIYQYGAGIKINYGKALELYQMAIKKNDTNAFNALGTMYKYGMGVKKDLDKAIELYQQAIENGNFDEICTVGSFYCDLNNYDTACYYYAKWSIKTGDFNHGLKEIIDNKNVQWTTQLHQFWCDRNEKTNTNKIIMTLLLVSKHRKVSKKKYIKPVLVKGITMKIIKWYAFYLKL